MLSSDYARFRRYAEAKTLLARALAVAEPDNISMKLALPEWELDVNADTRPLRQAIDSHSGDKSRPWNICYRS